MKANSLIQDGQTLAGAQTRFGSPIPVYDDGSGPLWILRDSMGISGIVRADSFQSAHEICEDEFYPEADESLSALIKEYAKERKHVKIIRPTPNSMEEREATAEDHPLQPGQFVRWETRETVDSTLSRDQKISVMMENELFQEAFGTRPNGPNKDDKQNHGFYAKDLNGDSLDKLTPELLEALEITLAIEGEADE